MRNSVIPMVGIVVVSVLAVLMVPSDVDTGRDGPQVHSGILRLPVNRERLVASADTAVQTEVIASTRGTPPPGIEPEGWRVVSIALEDTQPLTRAVALGLGERLTDLGVVAVMDLPGEPILPTPPDRVFRIGTQPDALGSNSGQIRIRQTSVRLPAWHTAAGLQGAASIEERSWHLRHVAESAEGDWPQRWAASGRHVADHILRDLGVSEGLPGDWDRPRPTPPVGRYIPYAFHSPGSLALLIVVPLFLVVRIIAARRAPVRDGWRGRWHALRPWAIAGALTTAIIMFAGPYRLPISARPIPLSTWQTHLPLPPNLEVIRWQGCFEDDLVRGWIGRIDGVTTEDRLKRPIPSIQPVLKLLAKKRADDGSARAEGDGLWREEQAPSPGAYRFGRNRDGVDEFLIAIPDAEGWDCVLWQEQPKANSIQDSWCDAVVDGEHVAIARQKLRRHLLATRIPEDQRARARTLLRRDPDAVEVAMLAETSDASAGERSYAAQARWVLGRAERSTPGEVHWLQLGVGETVACDGRSILVELGSAMGLVLLGFGDQGEMILRSDHGVASARITAGPSGSATAPGGGTLVIAGGPTGPQLTRR